MTEKLEKQAIPLVAKAYNKRHHILKVVEEGAELTKELIDYLEKPKKGKLEAVAAEAADLEIRLAILSDILPKGYKKLVKKAKFKKFKKYVEKHGTKNS